MAPRTTLLAMSSMVLVLTMFLPIGATPMAAEKEPAAADEMFTFHRVHLTLENGESVRADVARVADDRVILYDHRALETDTLIRPRVEEATRAVDMLEISELEVRKSYANTGATIGAIGGLAALSLKLIELQGYAMDPQWLMAQVAFYGIAGAAIGGLTGSLIPRWETVYDPAEGVALKRPSSYEPGVGYRLKEE